MVFNSITRTSIRFSIVLILVIFGRVAFAQALQERNVSLQGKIVNYNPAVDNKSFALVFYPLEDQRVQQAVSINADGMFKFKTGIAYVQEVTMLYKNYKRALLFNPGDSLNLVVDTSIVPDTDQKLLDDRLHYQSLINEMEDANKLKKYDMNDNRVISAAHADFAYKLYRKVTGNFSPDSAILFKKAATERDVISMAKLIIWNIQHQTAGFTRDVFFTRLFLDALNGYQLKEFDELWDEKMISDPWFKLIIRKKELKWCNIWQIRRQVKP